MISASVISEAVILDLTSGSVGTVHGKFVVFIVENNVEVLHEDVTKDIFILPDLVTVDADLANLLTILVGGANQIILGSDDIGSVGNEVESECLKLTFLGLAWAFKEAGVSRFEIAAKS
jgi:hypothetical protein